MLPILVHSVHSFCDDTAISHSLIFRLVCFFQEIVLTYPAKLMMGS